MIGRIVIPNDRAGELADALRLASIASARITIADAFIELDENYMNGRSMTIVVDGSQTMRVAGQSQTAVVVEVVAAMETKAP